MASFPCPICQRTFLGIPAGTAGAFFAAAPGGFASGSGAAERAGAFGTALAGEAGAAGWEGLAGGGGMGVPCMAPKAMRLAPTKRVAASAPHLVLRFQNKAA